MKLAKIPLPCDIIYGELERFAENDIIDFDAIIVYEKLYEIDHYLLKLKAKQILENRGFEVDAPRSEIFGCYDVIAKKGDYQINVECGVTPGLTPTTPASTVSCASTIEKTVNAKSNASVIVSTFAFTFISPSPCFLTALQLGLGRNITRFGF